MNEFTKDRSTAEQLVEKLDNELEMTICSDVVHGLDYEYKQLQKENQELKKQLEEKNNKLNSVLDYIDSNIFIEQFENVGNENNVRKEIIKRITNDKEV